VNQAIEARDYQVRIVQRTLKAIADGHRNVLIESATGSGKTVIGHLIARELNRLHGWTVGWTAMRRHLVAQAAEENARRFGLGCVRYFSTFDSEPPAGIDVLFDDEAHHSASETSVTLYRRLAPKVTVGLSATPVRTDRMRLCFSKVVRDAGIRALIDGGWLAPFHHYTAESEWTPHGVARLYLSDPLRWGRSVVFLRTVEECNGFARLLAAGGVRCEVVHGSSEQEAQLAAFRAGAVDVLANVAVLTEGFDACDLRTAFVRPASAGPTLQMAGRALRRHPEKAFAQVVQCTAADWPFTKAASAERKFVQEREGGPWRERGGTDARLAAAHAAGLSAVAATEVSLPAFLTRRRKRRRFAGAAQPG
jgi:superfamily II DNA or RNA helicase